MTQILDKMKKGLLLFLASSSLSIANDCCYTSDCCYNSDCCEDSCFPIRVEADYLLWQLRQPYDYSSTITEGQDETHTQYHDASFDYKSGARIGLFYDCLFPCLDVGVIWTTYYTSCEESLHANDNQHFSIDNDADQVRNKHQIHLNYVDLDFSSKFSPLCCFSLRPHAGVRALWLKFDDTTKFSGDIGSTTNTLAIKRHISDEDRGIGLEGGIWAEWKLGCGFSLVGHFGGSVLLYQDKYHEKVIDITRDVSGNELTNVLTTEKETVRSSQQTFDYFLGVQYDTCVCNRDIYVKVGWEHIFLNYEYFQFQGLTAGLGVAF